MKQIIVTIDADGQVKIDAIGFRGSACDRATEAIERALGKPTGGGKVRKPEFNQQQQQTQGH